MGNGAGLKMQSRGIDGLDVNDLSISETVELLQVRLGVIPTALIELTRRFVQRPGRSLDVQPSPSGERHAALDLPEQASSQPVAPKRRLDRYPIQVEATHRATDRTVACVADWPIVNIGEYEEVPAGFTAFQVCPDEFYGDIDLVRRKEPSGRDDVPHRLHIRVAGGVAQLDTLRRGGVRVERVFRYLRSSRTAPSAAAVPFKIGPKVARTKPVKKCRALTPRVRVR